MIVNKNTKCIQTRSDASNFNWLKSDDWYVVDDNSPLANKIKQLYPRFDFVLDGDKLVDVVEIQKTQEEINEEKVDEIKKELEELDNTINRATEDLYKLTNTTPYQKTAEVIQRKEELREELRLLQESNL